jgi:hypothetical protein
MLCGRRLRGARRKLEEGKREDLERSMFPSNFLFYALITEFFFKIALRLSIVFNVSIAAI